MTILLSSTPIPTGTSKLQGQGGLALLPRASMRLSGEDIWFCP